MRQALLISVLLAGSTAAFASVDEGLLALVPPGAKLITSVDVSQAKNSPFGQYMLNRINSGDQNLEELIKQTGFDPRRDLQDFVFASPGPSSGVAQSKFALLVRGTFDTSRIEASAKSKGASIQNYQGVDLVSNPSGQEAPAFAFPEVGVAVIGDIATVQEVIANRGNATALDAAMQQLVSSVSANDAWFASLMPGSYLAKHVKQETSQPMPGQALQSILQSSGGIRFGDTVQLSFDAIARSSKDATSLTDVIRFLGSLVQTQRQKDPHADILASAIDNMSLSADGNAVHVSISIPERSLEQLADLGPRPAARRRH